MGWSIGYSPLKDSFFLDAFLLSVGKALFLATMFEAKCRYILRLARIVSQYEMTGDASAALELVKTMKDETLGKTLRNLGSVGRFDNGDITLLDKAKDARNYIAHGSAEIGSLYDVTVKNIEKRIERLRREVIVLANGDNLVSCWIYEIEEKEPAPKIMRDEYTNHCVRWVFDEHEFER